MMVLARRGMKKSGMPANVAASVMKISQPSTAAVLLQVAHTGLAPKYSLIICANPISRSVSDTNIATLVFIS